MDEQHKELYNWLKELLDGHEKLDQARFDAIEAQINRRFIAQERNEEQQVESAKQALTEFKTDLVRRFENVNEFRVQLSKQEETFLTKAEAEQRFKILETRQAEVFHWKDTVSGQTEGRGKVIGYVIAVIGLLVGLIVALISHMLK